MSDKRFPIQVQKGAAAHPLTISWALAEKAYSVYDANYGFGSQTLERLAERGGFAPSEMDMFLPGWREMETENATLRAEVERLKERLRDFVAKENAELAALHDERNAALAQVEALKKERDDFKWKYENESNRIGATRLAEINALRARSEAAESEATRLKAERDEAVAHRAAAFKAAENWESCAKDISATWDEKRKAYEAKLTRLKAERDEAMAAGYAQGVEATEARASKRIAALEADYERVQKLSSDAGSKGHKLLAELTRLREREKVLVRLLGMMFDKWENGDDVREGGDMAGSFLGKAVSLSDEEEQEVLAALSAEPEGKNVAP